MPFAVKIHGSNTSPSWATQGETVFEGACSHDGDWVTINGGSRAVFATEEEAHAVGLACRWNNQTYSVHPARNSQTRDPEPNVKVDLKVSLQSCQDGYSR